jgi:hypothetical protein
MGNCDLSKSAELTRFFRPYLLFSRRYFLYREDLELLNRLYILSIAFSRFVFQNFSTEKDVFKRFSGLSRFVKTVGALSKARRHSFMFPEFNFLMSQLISVEIETLILVPLSCLSTG